MNCHDKLSDLNNSECLYYIDRNNALQNEERGGFCARIVRGLTSMVGLRTYDIEKVATFANSSSSVDDLDRRFINNKVAKKNGVDQETLEKIQKYEARFHPGDPESQTKSERTQYLKLWVQYGQDVDLFDAHYEDIKFLFDTQVLPSIIGFKNATKTGPTNHMIKKTDEGLRIKKQGQWVLISNIRKELEWDHKRKALCSKENPSERWHYFSPDGLLPNDRFYYYDEEVPEHNKMVPSCEKISQDEMQELLQHARKFDPDPSKKAVLQIISTPRLWGVPFNPLTNNLMSQIPIHGWVRLILEDGTVFSTGFGSSDKEFSYCESVSTCLSARNAGTTVLDYEEFSDHEGRIITTVPISQTQVDEQLTRMNTYREYPMRFHLWKQNCMRYVWDSIRGAGIDLDIKTHIDQLFLNSLPDPKQLPVIKYVAKPLDNLFNNLPASAKSFLITAKKITLFTPKCIAKFSRNVILAILGGYRGTPPIKNENQEEISVPTNLENFEYIQNSFLDLFRSEPGVVYHSAKVIEWQLKQKSTCVHSYSGQPTFNILPSNDDEKGKKQEELFKKVFLQE